MVNKNSWYVKPLNWLSGTKSKRIPIDFLEGDPSFQAPELHVDISIKEFIFKDADLASNVRRLVDNICLNTPVIVSKDGEEVTDEQIKKYNHQLGEVRFGKVLRSGVYSLIWSGNAFFEVRKNGAGELKELDFIDSEFMKIRKNKKGEVIGYQQEIPNHKVINFEMDEIVHITLDHLDTGAFGDSFIGALRQSLIRKDIAEYYLQWIIAKNKLNRFWLVKGDMNEDDWMSTVNMLRQQSSSPDKTTVIGIDEDVEVEFKRFFDTEDFESIQKYIDEQKTAILSVLQIPPIIGGNVDSSNRSNSEVQARVVFYNTVRNFQNTIVEELSFELLRNLGWDKVVFTYPHTDRGITAEVFKIATAMQGLGFTNEAVLEYLKKEGFEVPKVKELFNPAPELGDGMDGSGRNPLAPTASREPRAKLGIPQNEKKRKSDQKAKVTQDAN